MHQSRQTNRQRRGILNRWSEGLSQTRVAPRNRHRPRLMELEDRVLLTLNFDPSIDLSDFRVTTFATGLDYPYGMAMLDDGSLLVATSKPSSTSYFNSTGQIVRLVDANNDGVADNGGSVVFDGLPGAMTALERAGDLLLVVSGEENSERISVLRPGATPSSTMSLAGEITFDIPDGFEHKVFALASRPTPGSPGSYDIFFNLGAASNNEATTETVSVGGLLSGSIQGDSIYMFTLQDGDPSVSASGLTQIATGLRNAAGIAVHPVTGDLYFEDNGIDTPGNRSESFSADELNRIAAADIGGAIEGFGFPNSYVEYRTGTVVGGGLQPLVTFQPIPDPQTGDESEGPAEIAIAPSNFPPGFNNGVFVGFHGQFNSAGAGNEENPLVYYDLDSGSYIHFIRNDSPDVGHLDGLLATTNSLFVADLSSAGSMSSGAGSGVIYQITSLVEPEPDQPEIAVFDGQDPIEHGTGTISFGETTVGSAVSKTFTVRNNGAAILSFQPPVMVPNGFSLENGLGASQIGPGESTTFTVALSADAVGSYAGTVSIASNDPQLSLFEFNVSGEVVDESTPPRLSIDDISAEEGDQGATVASFTVTLSRAVDNPVTVAFEAVDGSATAGQDYQVLTQSPLTIPAGETQATIEVELLGDSINEADETFSIVLSNPTGATIERGEGAATILDDDSPSPTSPPQLTIEDLSVFEGDQGSATVQVLVRLSQVATSPVEVSFLVSPGTATANQDYRVLSQSPLTIQPGQTEGVIVLEILGDTLIEGDESFSILLSTPTGASIERDRATVTILDDDENGGGGPSPEQSVIGDYDGDGIADLALYHHDAQRNAGVFALRLSNNGQPTEQIVEVLAVAPNVIPVSGDFDGDGKADVAVVDPTARLSGSAEPNASVWIILLSGSSNLRQEIPFGAAGILDRPAPADFDGDGITDIATFRANSDLVPGAAQWFIRPSRTQAAYSVVFGAPGGTDLPSPADFDGDGKADIVTFRPVRTAQDVAAGVPDGAQWFILPSELNDDTFSGRVGAFGVNFGASGNADQPAVADFNNDNRADITAFRSDSDLAPGFAQWFILPTTGSSPNFGSGFLETFGAAGQIAAVADYNGNGRPDLTVFDQSSGSWTIREGTDGAEQSVTFAHPRGRAVPVLSPLFFRLRETGNLPVEAESSIGSLRALRLDLVDAALESLIDPEEANA